MSDALLLAFPALGLAKIVWATDIIWAFDIASGRCVAKGDRPLNEFQHKVEKGRLLASW